MSDGKEPPPGGGSLTNPSSPRSHPEQRTGTSAWAGDSVAGGTYKMRTFEQILEDEKTQRNILESYIQKLSLLRNPQF